ncbi:MAG: lysylphosphatidylglycerol synthase transmembrane domain-containing protein, partial [Planctomycetota bacterium]
YDAWRAGAGKGLAVTSVVVDRLIGLVALAGFAVVALAFLHGPLIERVPGVRLWAGLALLGTLGMTWAMFARNERIHGWIAWAIAKLPAVVGGKVGKIYGALSGYRGQTRTVAVAFAISVVLQTKVVLFYYAIGRALGLEIGLANWFVIVPVAIFIMLAPISINGVGLRESVFTFLLATVFTASRSEALAFAWIEYGIFLFFGLVGGLVYMLRPAPPEVSAAGPEVVETSGETFEGTSAGEVADNG